MKKILLLTLLIILIPYLIVNFFIADNEIKLIYSSDMAVRVKLTDENKIINVPFEDYIIGVLAGEMPVSFEIEALKAQAVAARSYVMKKMLYNKDKEYDVVDTVVNQVYLSNDYLKKVWKDEYTTKINKIKQAVLETYNEYLDYNGSVADAMFFSTSVGMTENSEDVFQNKVPYLRSVVSEWDQISPVYQVNYSFDIYQFYQLLNLDYSEELKIEITNKTSTGRVKELKINGKKLKAQDVVTNLKLKSSFFTIKKENNKVNITTKGYGHGVGMSQYGAQGMALNGYKYDEILKYYYQGVTIKKI